MQVWCAGVSIGNYEEEHCALYPAFEGFERLAGELPTLWISEFGEMSNEALWNFLDGMLYSYHGDTPIEDDRTAAQCSHDWEIYGKFDFLTNWGEQFDRGGKSFIMCTPAGIVRILNRSLPVEFGMSLTAPLEEVLHGISLFRKWFASEEKRLERPIPI